MRPEEAQHIGAWVRRIAAERGGPVVNIGSSTGHFRTVVQPHIEAHLFGPLRALGVPVYHSDLKAVEGVDFPGDIYTTALQERLRALAPQVVLASNLMEHLTVAAREAFPGVLDRIVAPGGYIIVTVPHSYPFHPDPIDTYFRPSPEELRALWPAYELIDGRTLVSSTYLPMVQAMDLKTKLRQVVRFFVPIYKPVSWASHVHRHLWLFRPFVVSCVVLRKPASSPTSSRPAGPALP